MKQRTADKQPKHGHLTYEPAYEHSRKLRAMADETTIETLTGPDHAGPFELCPDEKNDPHIDKIAILEDGQVAGMIEFTRNTPCQNGFFLGEAFRGRGIITRAWEDNYGLYMRSSVGVFSAGTWEDNAAAQHVLESIGFEEESRQIHERGIAINYWLVISRDEAVERRSRLVPTIAPIYCPFCGPGMSQTETYFDYDNTKHWRVACGACGTHSGFSPRTPHPDNITRHWNKRPTTEGT